jgi:hypothetical protein
LTVVLFIACSLWRIRDRRRETNLRDRKRSGE